MKGRIESLTVSGRGIIVYLPPSYSVEQHYPVSYIHDSGDLFNPAHSNSLNELEKLFQDGELQEVILVGIESENRLNEYTPWFAKAIEPTKFNDFGGNGDLYLSFIVEKLIPLINQKYSTSVTDTSIIGKSLGGLISIYAAFCYPDHFKKVGCISGSFWFDGILPFMERNELLLNDMKIYMDVGTEEGKNKTTIQCEMVDRTILANQILRTKGLSDSQLRFKLIDGADHKRHYFIQRFPTVVKWLYQRK
ncbi:alpha/beta hydrolase [Aquibacillus kalidii]|uniref:alpha/beta hydrolase n=1 Tax=Aquibacillus kalidii TaxID=2762597 RepID=UPI0016458615|nr:alpha/beta hydrolase-fold protein [Aquibacillus kalidii]